MTNKKFNPLFNSYLIYVGVAIASGGVALYTPLIVSETGKHFSGFWAASILFGLNLGRVVGSYLGSKFPKVANHPLAVSGNILLEGVALYCMAFLDHAWALAAFALLAGLGSGLSFPGLKNYLLKLRELDQSSLFSRLAFAIRMGLVGGYLTASWVPEDSLKVVFLIVLITFVAYALFMLIAMKAITKNEIAYLSSNVPHLTQQQHPPLQVTAQSDLIRHPRSSNAGLPVLFYLSNAIFWCFAVQPMIGFSLHIPKYTPEIPVSTPFWIAALVIIFFQIPISKRAVRTYHHFRFLQIGYVCLFLSFVVMTLFSHSGTAVIISAILLSFGQVFYGPSLDVLTARFADKVNADTGQLMSRQMIYQSMGNMIGSMAGGLLFDLAQSVHMPALNWLLLAAGSLVMVIVSKNKIPMLYRNAGNVDLAQRSP